MNVPKMKALAIPILLYILINLALTNAIQNETNILPEAEGEGGLVSNVPSITIPNDDPENKLDIIQKARNNEFSNEIITNKTRAMVSCDTGEMLVKINFTEPFRGVAYTDADQSSPCRFFGEGGTYYEMRLPLKGCGTRQEAPRLFVNDIILRFHRSLHLLEDERKTIVCRYPPPEAPIPPPPPVGPPEKIITAPEPAKLTQYEPFVIIAGLLFFALLLAGLGTTSYVTRKQILKPINTPLPITSTTEYDDYIDKQSIITTEEIDTNVKIVPFPKLSTQIVDDVFITIIDEKEVLEDITHHKHTIPKPHLEHLVYDDTFITNQEEIIDEENISQQQLVDMRRLDRQDCDDAYITNQDEIEEEEIITNQKMLTMPSKIELRTIEDTFITNVDEVVENKNTTYLKNRDDRYEEHYEDHEEYREGYREC